jgi:hypothetical protein
MRLCLHLMNRLHRQPRIYVRAFAATEPGGKWQISVGGGCVPKWRRDGRELFYRSDNRMMAVQVNAGATFRPGVPEPLFETRSNGISQDYVVAANGQRFLVPTLASVTDSPALTVVINWTKEIKQ